MNDNEMFKETVAQRRGLVAILNGLSEGEWDQPSLCQGWRIREVVAHITMPYRHSGATVLAAVVRAQRQV